MSDYDVIVAGGGPSGTAAAIAAGRMGKRVALLERHDVLGGMGTVALVNNFCPAHLDGRRLIIGGIFGEIRRRLIALKAIYTAPDDAKYMMEPYAPDVFAGLLITLCRDAGVDVLTRCGEIRTKLKGDSVEGIHVSDRLLRARTFVDATGDAAVAAQAGVAFRQGRERDGAVMPLTFCYRMGPIRLSEVKAKWPKAVELDERTGEEWLALGSNADTDRFVAEARAKGELKIPRDHISGIASVPGQPENATVNFGRVWCKDPADAALVALAEVEGRRQIDDGVAFFRKYLPGFSEVRVLEVARQIGVRESRQIVGQYTLTEEDCLGCRQFEDVIAQCCYMIDIHSPDSDATVLKKFASGTHYDIPFRCLVPQQGAQNIIVAGRCISATHEAMSSFRVSPSVMAIGEAAGVAAALAAGGDGVMKQVDSRLVQAQLRETGAILE